MKIAICLGFFSIGTRPLDFHFNNIYESTRGLTGTDLTFIEISKGLAARGHEVYMFTVHAQPHNKPNTWQGMKLYSMEERTSIVDDTFDCIISINEPDVFRGMVTKPLRICWNFLNDFTYCSPGFNDYVDLWLGVCDTHTNHLKSQVATPEKWNTVPLGCDPSIYKDERIPGRVVWCSSADRGLHWLLQQWPIIKAAVPHATLKVFYHFNYVGLESIEPQSPGAPSIIELAHRVRYMRQALPKLKKLGVEHVGSISRNQMAKELNQASVFAFSCDTVAFTEGFSVSTMEAHASYTVPVITDKDCLGSIYSDSGSVMIKGPLNQKLTEYTNSVIEALTDQEFANQTIKKCRDFAGQHSWNLISENLEKIIIGQHKGK